LVSSALIATFWTISYQVLVMMPALSEPVALPPGRSVRLERVHQPAGEPVPERFLHFHGVAELVFLEKGEGRFVCESGEFALAPGSVVYAPGMAIHDFAFEPGVRRWTLVQFDPLAVDPRVHAFPAAAAGAYLTGLTAERTTLLLDWLASCLKARAPEAQVLVVLEALLLALDGTFGEPAGAGVAPAAGLARFRPLLQHWERSPDKVLALAEAATLCGLSPTYFSRLFAKTFGAGFIAYQTRHRLQQAARLLATSDLPVSQIGYRFGFQSHAYFTQCFKAVFGVAPSAHRIRGRG
jgi:AraC-like DNA-binding protein